MILFPIACFLLFIYYFYDKTIKTTNFPPGPPKLPLWGTYWLVLKENYQHAHLAFASMGKKYNTDLLGVYLGDDPIIVPLTHDLCKEALNKEEFAGRPDTMLLRMRAMGELRGIFFIDGPVWQDQRRFSLRHMRDFGFGRRSEDVEDVTTEEVKYLVDLLSNPPKPENLEVNPEKGVALFPDLLYSSLLRIILHIMSSSKYTREELHEFGRNALKFQRSTDPTGTALGIAPWLRHVAPDLFGYTDALESNTFLLNFARYMIEDRRKTFSDDHHRDFIDAFLSEQLKMKDVNQLGGFTDEQLMLIIVDVIFPAGNAIGQTLSNYFGLLINHPEVQVQVQKEIDLVIGSRQPELDDRANMPYLQATLREAFRIYPMNPLLIPRRCTEDTTFAGYFIPKDTVILPCAWTAHRDTDKFGPDVEEFRPERFLDSQGNLMQKDHTIGFGNGQRLCAGETFAKNTLFLFIAGFLQHFTFSSRNGEKVDFSKWVPGANISLDNNFVRVQAR